MQGYDDGWLRNNRVIGMSVIADPDSPGGALADLLLGFLGTRDIRRFAD